MHSDCQTVRLSDCQTVRLCIQTVNFRGDGAKHHHAHREDRHGATQLEFNVVHEDSNRKAIK